MPKSTLYNAKIKGISCVVPKCELSLLDMPNLYNGNEKKIKRVIESSGFLKRRVASDSTTTADLCECAANDLIKNLNIDKKSIDAILFSSYTPDYLMPATSYVLHKKLDLSENCICMDIPQACSGYILGLYQASMLLNSGCKRILLLVGDTFSKFSDMFKNNSAPVFGDAGSATLIDYDEDAKPIYFNIKSDGAMYESLICENGAFRNPVKSGDFYEDNSYKYESKMLGAEIFNFTLEKIAPLVQELLEYSKVELKNIDRFAFHQANKFILKNIALQLGLDENAIPSDTLSKYGNQCGASIPCMICDIFKKEVESSDNKTLLCGFGVGLSWAAAVADIDKIYCSNVIEYDK